MSAVPDMSGRRRLVVGSDVDQRRLDAWLAAQLPELSRSRIARLLADGHVLVNGQPARKSQRPEPGDVVEIELPPPVSDTLEPEPIPLEDLSPHVPDGLEIEAHEGGQPSWWWLLAAQ